MLGCWSSNWAAEEPIQALQSSHAKTDIEGTKQVTLMRKLWFVTGLALILVLVATPFARAQGSKPSVRGYLFYSQDCPACDQVRTGVIPQLYKEFGQQLQIKAIDIDADENNRQWLLACAEQVDLPEQEADVPILFMGDEVLIGADEIASKLPSLIEQHLDRGVSFPDVPRPGEPLQPTARFMFFYSPDCPHCHEVEEEIFPKLRDKYGEQLQWEAYDRSEEINYRALLILGEITGIPEEARGAVPLIFMGDEYSLYARFLGSIEIEQHLEPAIEWYMTIGGVDWPGWREQLFEMAATPFPEPTPEGTQQPALPTTAGTRVPTRETIPTSIPASPGKTTQAESQAIHMAYFAEAGCSECDAVSAALEQVQKRYPALIVHEMDIIEDLKLNLCLSEMLNVPENQRHDAPAVFVGSDYLVGKDVHYQNLMQRVEKYAATGAEPIWETCQPDKVQLPPPPPWWAVILPGLADGINPCAFATIIFFVSYLSLIERKGRDIILVGIAFTLAVFLSYLAFGIVLREILSGLIEWTGPILRPILNGVTAVLCLLLAIVSFSDFTKARQGKAKDMALRLPDRLRKWVNATIRHSMRSETLVAASFVAGVIVSFIELACTGQVYVPIILGLSTPGYRSQALVSLIVYCLAFIVPLVIVFAITYMGTSSQKLGVFLQRHTSSIKLITALLFLGIGLWLIYDTLRVWGVLTPWFVATASF
jgi:cytochrome c biogenesis protein CcdA/thiol-disulfide isomerase/thioredoxin